MHNRPNSVGAGANEPNLSFMAKVSNCKEKHKCCGKAETSCDNCVFCKISSAQRLLSAVHFSKRVLHKLERGLIHLLLEFPPSFP